jgi:PKD repeat protein
MKIIFPRILALLTVLFVMTSVKLDAQPATYDKDKNKDPMVIKPGYTPKKSQLTSGVITIDDYDNFKLGVDAAECSIANNPRNPLQFYAVWNSSIGTSGGNGYFTNDGYTWTAGNPTWNNMLGDVVVAYDSIGNLAYQNMYGLANAVQSVKVAMSPDNGQTWAAPLTAMPGSDKNWLYADQTYGPYSNYIYGTMTNPNGNGQSYSRSTDEGETWESPTSFNPGGALPGTSVCVGPEGNTQGGAVFVVTNSGDTFTSTFTFFKSIDGGQAFSLKSVQHFTNTVGTQVGSRHAVLNMRTRPYPFIAADNSYGPHRGRLYLVYTSNDPPGSGNKPDIFCRYSDDGGSTWSSAKVVNDDANTHSNHNWFPAIWCEKNTGRLYVSWMDTRDTPTSDSCMIYASFTNDGVSFAPNYRISNKKMKINCTSCGGGGTPMYLGDYNGVTANPVTSMMAWTDFRDNTFGSYVAYFPDFALRAEPAIDTISPAATIYARVPSVKAFTDTVNISASISGAPDLFTITYPQGSKLWSYPGLLPIQIIQNGLVPPADYILTISASGSNGTPVHKRTAIVRALVPIEPEANFISNDTSACKGQVLNFTDFSVGPPTSWQWSFPGGTPSSSTIQNPTGIVYDSLGTFDVSLTVTNQLGSSSITRTNYITVNPVPDPPVANSIVVCEGQQVPDFMATGTGIKWYKGSLLVGSGNTFKTGLTNPGVYKFTVVQSANGCQSLPTEVILTINALPNVAFLMADSVCANAAAFDLTGGSPLGGYYSGPGVSSNGLTFDPAVAGTGVHTLKYVYSDNHSCSDSAYHTLIIQPLPVVTMDPLSPMCRNAPAVTLSGTPAGGTFHGIGVSGTIFDPTISGPGEFTVRYSYPDPSSNCIVSASQVIKVNPLPAIALNDTSVCGNRTLILDAGIPNASSYLWTPGNLTTSNISVDTTGRGLGQYTYSIAITDANACLASKSIVATFFDCTGIDEALNTKEIELFPNPGPGLINVYTNSIPDGSYNLRVYNAQSSLVYNEDNLKVGHDFRKLLNLGHLPNGIYLLRLENSVCGWGRQFIINR